MIRSRKSKAPNWSSEEIAILIDIYPREGVNGAADALPERSWGSIQNMAHKLGAKIARDVYREVDRLLMEGFGAPRVADLTGVSRTHVLRRRTKLLKRLARKGDCLSGCDAEGRRIAYKDSLASVHPIQQAILRAEIMKGTAVSRAARVAGVGGSYAHKFYHMLKDELGRQGRDIPPAIKLGSKADAVDRVINWLPVGKKNLIVYRRHLIATDGDQVAAKRRTIAELMPKPTPKPAEPRRRMTFEEQMEAVRNGARLVNVQPLRRPDTYGTLGGVSAGML